MPRTVLRFTLFLLLAVGAVSPCSTSPFRLTSDECLEYGIVYRGILSAWSPVDVAAARLCLQPGRTEGSLESTLAVTTESFPIAEMLYPFRFSYMSRFDPEAGRSLLVHQQKQTSKKLVEVLWFDYEAQRVQRFKKDRRVTMDSGNVLARFRRSGVFEDESLISRLSDAGAVPIRNRRMLDRLFMLQFLRTRPLATGDEFRLPVTNGKDLKAYQVTVLDPENISLGGVEILSAIKIRLDPLYGEPDEEALSVFVWYSLDDRRLPLRFGSETALWSVDAILKVQPRNRKH